MTVWMMLYAAFALITSGVLALAVGTRARVATFVIAFWILGGSIIQQESFILPLKAFAGGNMLLSQLIVYFLAGYMVLMIILQLNSSRQTTRMPYEKFFYLLAAWFFVVVTYHVWGGSITGREYKGLLESTMAVPVVYIIIKREGDEGMVRALVYALIIVGIVSSLVAIVQFFVAQDFLRVGSLRPAFAGRLRSNGVFAAEYTNSYFLIAAMMAVFLYVKPAIWRRLFVGLFLIAIFLSFHRMSWIITIGSYLMYLVYVRKHSLLRLALLGVVASLGILVITTLSKIQGSEDLQSRLTDDTLTDRFKYYTMVIENVDKVFWWGAGSMRSSTYYWGMLSVGQPREWARGDWGGIHNLYLEMLFLYGVPIAAMYIAMILSMLRKFRNLMQSRGEIFFLPFSFVVMYIFMNLTNSFPLGTDVGFLFTVLAACGTAMAVTTEEPLDVVEPAHVLA